MRAVLIAIGLSAWLVSAVYADYKARGRRDPFIPLLNSAGERFRPPGIDEEDPSEAGLQSLTLQGVMYDPNADSFVIINDHILREQEEINGMKILKIGPTSITILVEGKPVQLTVKKPTDQEENSKEL